MAKFTEWLKQRDETFRALASIPDDEVPEITFKDRGAFPAYSVGELPPTPQHRMKKKCGCKSKKK